MNKTEEGLNYWHKKNANQNFIYGKTCLQKC